MGIFSVFFGRKKRKVVEPILVPPHHFPPEISKISSESTMMENVKSKMDLVLTQLDSIRTDYQIMNERVSKIEKILKEIYELAKS